MVERRKRGTEGKALVSRKELKKREMLPEPISTAPTDTSFIGDQLYYLSFIQPAIPQLLKFINVIKEGQKNKA
jgi:hypothetical protein